MDAPIATIRSIFATCRASALTIRIGLIVRSQVALLRAIHDSIAAVSGKQTVPGASAIRTIIDSVIALLVSIDYTVAAVDAAVYVARARIGPIVNAVVALFPGIDDAVSTST